MQAAAMTMNHDIAAQRAIAGTTPLQGVGIDLLLDDSRTPVLLPTDPVDNYIVHEYQIRDVATFCGVRERPV